MKLRSILSGITALLMVGTFYTFAFCMVEDVDEHAISMDYYYSTETDAKSGEMVGEATSVNVTEEEKPQEVKPVQEKQDAEKINNTPAEDKENKAAETADEVNVEAASAEDEGTSSEESGVSAITQVPETEAADTEEKTVAAETAAEDEVDEFAEEEAAAEEDYEMEDDDSFSDDENVAYSHGVYATEADENNVLVKEETFITTPESVQINAYTSIYQESTVVTTIPPETTVTTITTIPTVEFTVDLPSSTVYYPSETTTTVTTPVIDVPAGSEMLTARYGGAVHTEDAYELVCKIVNNEISSYFSDEAIKAQAVAAYSYVKYNNLNGVTPSVLVKENPPQRIKEMVSAVWGKCCYYNGSVAQTVYMASSSGYTASSRNVWGGDVPYLVSVACPFDAESDPNYGLVTRFSESAIRTALENNLGITLSDDPNEWIKISAYIDGNYVSQVTIDNQKTITGRKLRENVLNYQLKSASFDVTYADGYFIFTTYGWGHGVGMSQNGANILAKMGYTYDQILKYYYTGIDVL